MARWREALRRWAYAIAPRFLACTMAWVALLGVLAVVGMTTRYYTVTATGDEKAFLLSPTVALAGEASVLALAGIHAAADDVVTYTELEGGKALLHVERAFSLTLTDGGASKNVTVVKGTVAEVLTQLGVTLGPEDTTEPSLETPVNRETKALAVHRVTYRDYSIDEVRPFETQYQYTSLFYRGKNRKMVIQEGRDGYLKADLRDRMVDGQVVETVTLVTQEESEPIPLILKVYKKGAPVSEVEAPAGITIGADGVPSSYSTVYDMKATGYYSARGRGSSGLGLYYGTFAVDPTLIPYGTKVYITSEDGRFVYGWAIATDTGGFIHTNRMQVDLFYETYAESAINAVMRVLVYVP